MKSLAVDADTGCQIFLDLLPILYFFLYLSFLYFIPISSLKPRGPPLDSDMIP